MRATIGSASAQSAYHSNGDQGGPALIKSCHLRERALVCDVSRPFNVAPEVIRRRKDVRLVGGGGLIKAPKSSVVGYVEESDRPHVLLSCAAETIMLALSGYQSKHRCGHLDIDTIEKIGWQAESFGFSVVQPSYRLHSDERLSHLGCSISQHFETTERAPKSLRLRLSCSRNSSFAMAFPISTGSFLSPGRCTCPHNSTASSRKNACSGPRKQPRMKTESTLWRWQKRGCTPLRSWRTRRIPQRKPPDARQVAPCVRPTIVASFR
jgi:hypothetical protein